MDVRRAWVAAVVGAVVSTAGGAAWADEAPSAELGARGAPVEHSVQGKVVKATARRAFVTEASGAVVPVELDSKTRFEGAASREKLEGKDISATVTVRGTRNIALVVRPLPANELGTGGSGGPGLLQEEQTVPVPSSERAPEDEGVLPAHSTGP